MRFSAGGSVFGYWLFGGSIGIRHNAWFGYAYSHVQRRPETTYIALEEAPGPKEMRTFDVTNWTSGGVLGVRPVPSLSIAASAGYLRQASETKTSEIDPANPAILNPAATTRYVSIGGHATLDLRDVKYEREFGTRYIPSADDLTDRPLNPESGSLVSVDVTRFIEQGGLRASFTQAEIEGQQYVSFLNGYHTFALRHRSVFTDPDGEAAVPFYQLPYVGGNFTLRGYDEFRFRGPHHALLYNLEYRYKVWHHMDAVLFGDAGKVFDRVEEWGFSNLRYSYGAGLRFVMPRTTLFRFGVALDENQRTQLIFEFSNVF
ncbi:MAG: BamA/TamA family outer membrane protein [Salinibacter sp.]